MTLYYEGEGEGIDAHFALHYFAGSSFGLILFQAIDSKKKQPQIDSEIRLLFLSPSTERMEAFSISPCFNWKMKQRKKKKVEGDIFKSGDFYNVT